MKTKTSSFDSRILKWGALALGLFVVGSFVTLPGATASSDDRNQGETAAHHHCKSRKPS
jgi:hypothetical protein